MRKLHCPSATSQLLLKKLSKIVECLFLQHPLLDDDEEREARVVDDERYSSLFMSDVGPVVDQVKGKKKVPSPDFISNKIDPATLHAVYTQCFRDPPETRKRVYRVLLWKGCKQEVVISLYRPLRLVNDRGKIFERILAQRIEEHFFEGGFADDHFGFRQNRSINDVVLEVRDYMVSVCNQKEYKAAMNLTAGGGLLSRLN